MAAQGREAPKPEDVYIVPTAFIGCLHRISRSLEGSGVRWSVIGDTAEIIHGVFVNPKTLDILIDSEGVEEFSARMAEYNPRPFELLERKLERPASVEGKEFPVFVRSLQTSFNTEGVEVHVHANHQTKVGDWDWGDQLELDSVEVNLAGVEVPVMPVRIASEIYLMLGWVDRANKITDAVHRAHHRLDWGF
jgi:hypothetical protein